MGRQLTIRRERRKHRDYGRRLRALRAWAAGFEGFFPEPVRNGFGQLNWYTRLPIPQRLVSGPRASAQFRRACAVAMVEAVGRIRRARPEAQAFARVVALLPVDDLFAASLDVFWGDQDFVDFFDRSGPVQAWTLLPDDRSLIREWELGTALPERGFATRERWDEHDEAHSGELWAIGDVELLRVSASR